MMEGVSGPVNRSQTLGSEGRQSVHLRPDSAEKHKKGLFTKGKKAKKAKRRSLTTNVVDLESMLASRSSPVESSHLQMAPPTHSHSVDESSEDRASSINSDLNWSVPDLFTQPPSQHNHSMENLGFSPTDSIGTSNLVHMCCASNPDLLVETPNEQLYRRVAIRHKTRRSVQVPDTFKKPEGLRVCGPHTCDIAVQVEAGSSVFRFPTPPNGLSPTHPSFESNKNSSTHTEKKGSRRNSALKKFHFRSKKSSSLDMNAGCYSLIPEESRRETEKSVEHHGGRGADQVGTIPRCSGGDNVLMW